jgi:ArsR family transcriptional regulator
VREIQKALGLAQSTASKHLKILEEAGLVSHFKEGQWVNYRLVDGSGNPYVDTMLENLKRWLEEDPEVVTLVRRLAHINMGKLCRR